MASLRQTLNKSRTWGILITVLFVLAVLDSFRSPSNQVTGRIYVGLVRVYQYFGRPVLKDRVQCRYHPSCSDYSIGAVEAHGIRRGSFLTVKRICSCTGAVPLGTEDPVPPVEE